MESVKWGPRREGKFRPLDVMSVGQIHKAYVSVFVGIEVRARVRVQVNAA